MYPTVVVVLVETQRSMTDICEVSSATKIAGPAPPESRPATLGHLSFAVGPMHSTIDIELESQWPPALQSQDGEEHGIEKVILEMKESQVDISD